MSEENKNAIKGNFGYQPNIEVRGYQPLKSLSEGYQPTSSKGEISTPPSTGSPVEKPKNIK